MKRLKLSVKITYFVMHNKFMIIKIEKLRKTQLLDPNYEYHDKVPKAIDSIRTNRAHKNSLSHLTKCEHLRVVYTMHLATVLRRPRGLMDKASDFGSED